MVVTADLQGATYLKCMTLKVPRTLGAAFTVLVFEDNELESK